MRGFARETKGGELQTTAYRKDSMFPTNLKGIGAQRHFYNNREEYDLETKLSQFENDAARFHQRLLARSFDPIADKESASRLLTNCAVRSKLMRTELALGIETFRETLRSVLSEKDFLIRFLKDHLVKNPDYISEEIEKRNHLGADLDWVSKVVNDNPEVFLSSLEVNSLAPEIEVLMSALGTNEEHFRQLQQNALKRSVVPQARVDALVRNQFWLVELSNSNCVLGDAMLINFNSKGNLVGGIDFSSEPVATALPISPKLVLISSPFKLDWKRLNFLNSAIECSNEFFIYPSQEAFLRKRTPLIGKKSGVMIRQIAKEAILERVSSI